MAHKCLIQSNSKHVGRHIHATSSWLESWNPIDLPDGERYVGCGGRNSHVVMVGLLAQVGRVHGLNEVAAGHRRHVHVHSELQLPRADLWVAVDAREPESGTRSDCFVTPTPQTNLRHKKYAICPSEQQDHFVPRPRTLMSFHFRRWTDALRGRASFRPCLERQTLRRPSDVPARTRCTHGTTSYLQKLNAESMFIFKAKILDGNAQISHREHII